MMLALSPRRCGLLLALSIISILARAQSPAIPPAPSTDKRPVTDVYQGVKVVDDYRWLEDWGEASVKQWSAAQNIRSCLGHHDLHDGLAVAGAGNRACFGVGIAAAADQRRIADATGKLAAGSSGRGSGEEPAIFVHGYGTDSALLMSAVKRGGVPVDFAAGPSLAFGFGDEFFGCAQGYALFVSEALGAIRDEHHVWATFKNLAGEADGIADVLQRRCGAGAERKAVHDDGVALNPAVQIEMRTIAGVEYGIIFQDYDGGFDGV